MCPDQPSRVSLGAGDVRRADTTWGGTGLETRLPSRNEVQPPILASLSQLQLEEILRPEGRFAKHRRVNFVRSRPNRLEI